MYNFNRSYSGADRPSGSKFAVVLIATFLWWHPSIAGSLAETMAKPDGFPEHPLTVVVPYGSGGSGQVSRAMARAVTEVTGVPVNIKYKPGNSGMDGLKFYMTTPNDGYTVLQHIDDAASAYASGKSSVHPAQDLVPLVISQITFSQIYIRGDDKRFTDWSSFVKFVRAQNGTATIANVSREGSMERINLKRIANQSAFKIKQSSFDIAADRFHALKTGQVDALFEQPGDVRVYVESGDFKPILTLLKERPDGFAQVPSMKDVGLTFTPLMRYRGFFVKNGLPVERLKWLQWAFQKSFSQASYQEFNKRKYMNLINSFRDTDGAKALINETIKTYKQTYKELGLIR